MRSFINIVAGFLLIVCLAGCATSPQRRDVPVANLQHKIYFIYREWHTSILLDAESFATQSSVLKHYLQGEKFARIGWGDGDYFTGKSKSWGTAAKALVASKYSAIQVLTYNYDPFEEIPADTIVPLMVSEEGFRQLSRYINESIALDPEGKPLGLVSVGDGIGEFFQAKGRYSAFSNCNTWSGQALRAAGLPVSNRLTARGVFNQASAISRIQTEAGLFK